jgi:hypothetical protein
VQISRSCRSLRSGTPFHRDRLRLLLLCHSLATLSPSFRESRDWGRATLGRRVKRTSAFLHNWSSSAHPSPSTPINTSQPFTTLPAQSSLAAGVLVARWLCDARHPRKHHRNKPLSGRSRVKPRGCRRGFSSNREQRLRYVALHFQIT